MAAELGDIKDREPNQDLIETLQNLLARAQSGDIRSALVAVDWSMGGVTTSWVMDPRTSPESMIGGLAIAQYELTTKVCLDRDDTILSQALYS